MTGRFSRRTVGGRFLASAVAGLARPFRHVMVGGSLLAWAIVGLAPLEAAPAPACEPLSTPGLSQRIDLGARALLEGRLDEALVLLSHTAQQLPCLVDVPSQQLYSQVWLDLGVVRRERGDAPGALAAFEQALMFYPELPWNNRFGERGRAEFEAARAALRQRGTVRLRLPRRQHGVTLYIDGAPAGDRRRVRVIPGRHLIQAVVQDRVVWTRWLEPAEELETDE